MQIHHPTRGCEQRLSLTAQGKVRYQLKTPYADGTTHVIFEPLDFISRLAALVPKPRVNLTRYHGVFAPNAASPPAHKVTQNSRNNFLIFSELGHPKPPAYPNSTQPPRWSSCVSRLFP